MRNVICYCFTALVADLFRKLLGIKGPFRRNLALDYKPHYQRRRVTSAKNDVIHFCLREHSDPLSILKLCNFTNEGVSLEVQHANLTLYPDFPFTDWRASISS